jgi:predicted unusual protein kinase regulating ubiquinone biosynthesis (AarF/ABC1/UbiB family)
LTEVVAISALTDHFCAARSSGEIRCWGEGSNGQLGDGDSQDRASLVVVRAVAADPAPFIVPKRTCSAVEIDSPRVARNRNWPARLPLSRIIGERSHDGRSRAVERSAAAADSQGMNPQRRLVGTLLSERRSKETVEHLLTLATARSTSGEVAEAFGLFAALLETEAGAQWLTPAHLETIDRWMRLVCGPAGQLRNGPAEAERRVAWARLHRLRAESWQALASVSSLEGLAGSSEAAAVAADLLLDLGRADHALALLLEATTAATLHSSLRRVMARQHLLAGEHAAATATLETLRAPTLGSELESGGPPPQLEWWQFVNEALGRRDVESLVDATRRMRRSMGFERLALVFLLSAARQGVETAARTFPNARLFHELHRDGGHVSPAFRSLLEVLDSLLATGSCPDEGLGGRESLGALAASADLLTRLPAMEFQLPATLALADAFARHGDALTSQTLKRRYAELSNALTRGRESDVWGLCTVGPRGEVTFASTGDLSATIRHVKLLLMSASTAGTALLTRLKQVGRSPARVQELREEALTLLAGRFRRHLQTMKGGLLKFGQLAPVVAEAFPGPLRLELDSLPYTAQVVDPAAIEGVIHAELGRPPSELFKSWSRTPIAAASIGQVHRAVLDDGTEVAVKVQYPGIEKAVRADFAAMRLLLPLLKALFPHFNAATVLDECQRLFLRECDYRSEAAYQTRLAAIARAEHSGIRIPEVFPQLSSARVLTSRYVDGMPLRDFVRLASAEERNDAALRLSRFFIEADYIHGIQNGDLHPGNILFRDDELWCLDFGACIETPAARREVTMRCFEAVLKRDRAALAAVLRQGFVGDAGRYEEDALVRAVETAISNALAPYGGAEFEAHLQTIADGIAKNFATLKIPKEFVAVLRADVAIYALTAALRPTRITESAFGRTLDHYGLGEAFAAFRGDRTAA